MTFFSSTGITFDKLMDGDVMAGQAQARAGWTLTGG